MSSEYLFSLKLMLVLFDVSFVHFYFILVNDSMVTPRPITSLLQNKIHNRSTLWLMEALFSLCSLSSENFSGLKLKPAPSTPCDVIDCDVIDVSLLASEFIHRLDEASCCRRSRTLRTKMFSSASIFTNQTENTRFRKGKKNPEKQV